jgi:hypothetical protein
MDSLDAGDHRAGGCGTLLLLMRSDWQDKEEAVGVWIFVWLGIVATILIVGLLCGCAGIENRDSYWNKEFRDPAHWDSSVWMIKPVEVDTLHR